MSGKEKGKSSGKRDLFTWLCIAIVVLSCACIGLGVFLGMPAQRYRRSMEEGSRYLKDMEYERAAESFQNAIEIRDDASEAHVGLGYAYAGQADESAAENPDELDPEVISTYRDAVDEMHRAKEIDEANPEIPIETAVIFVHIAGYEEPNDAEAAEDDLEAARDELEAIDGEDLTEDQRELVEELEQEIEIIEERISGPGEEPGDEDTEEVVTETITPTPEPTETPTPTPEPIPDGAIEGMNEALFAVTQTFEYMSGLTEFEPDQHPDQLWQALYYILMIRNSSGGQVYSGGAPRNEVEEAAGALTADPHNLPAVQVPLFPEVHWEGEYLTVGTGDSDAAVTILSATSNADGTVTCTVNNHDTEGYDPGTDYTFLLVKNEYYDTAQVYKYYYRVVKAVPGDEAPTLDESETTASGMTDTQYQSLYAGAIEDAKARVQRDYNVNAVIYEYLFYDVTGDGYKECFCFHGPAEVDRGYYVYSTDGTNWSYIQNLDTGHGNISGAYQDGLSVEWSHSGGVTESYFRWDGSKIVFVSEIFSGNTMNWPDYSSLGITPLTTYSVS